MPLSSNPRGCTWNGWAWRHVWVRGGRCAWCGTDRAAELRRMLTETEALIGARPRGLCLGATLAAVAGVISAWWTVTSTSPLGAALTCLSLASVVGIEALSRRDWARDQATLEALRDRIRADLKVLGVEP